MLRDERGAGCSSSSSSSSSRPSQLIQPPNSSIYGFGYPRPQNECASPVAYNMVSNAGSFSYSRFGNGDDSAQQSGWDHGGNFDGGDGDSTRPYMIRWKSGKRVDQRLMMLLESFYQEIYVKREDFFEKIFPEKHEEFTDVFDKIGAMLRKNKDKAKHRTMQRSLSVGSPRRPQRFKVKTPNVIVSGSDGQGGQTCPGATAWK